MLPWISVYWRGFFYLFCFAIYQMVDSEYSTNTYQSLNNSIGTVMRNPEMLKLIIILKLKKCASM